VRQLTRADLLAAAVGVVALSAGLVLVLAAGGTVATLGAVLLGLAGTAFVALAFLIVGESEDRDRRSKTL
jgi:ammonia channel protein AmtB